LDPGKAKNTLESLKIFLAALLSKNKLKKLRWYQVPTIWGLPVLKKKRIFCS